VYELIYGRAGDAARLVPAGSHTAVKISTIDCISWILDYQSCSCRNDTLYRFWWVRDGGGGFQSLKRKEYTCCYMILLIVLCTSRIIKVFFWR